MPTSACLEHTCRTLLTRAPGLATAKTRAKHFLLSSCKRKRTHIVSPITGPMQDNPIGRHHAAIHAPNAKRHDAGPPALLADCFRAGKLSARTSAIWFSTNGLNLPGDSPTSPLPCNKGSDGRLRPPAGGQSGQSLQLPKRHHGSNGNADHLPYADMKATGASTARHGTSSRLSPHLLITDCTRVVAMLVQS